MNDHHDQPDPNAVWRFTLGFILEGRWRELPDHLNLTTLDKVCSAAGYGLSYSPHDAKRGRGNLRTADARGLLTATGAFESYGRQAVLRTFLPPSPCRPEGKAVHWPVNSGFTVTPADRAWSKVFGIEDGWLAYDRAGFLQWTELGRNRYAAGESLTFTETSGQTAFTF